MVSFMKNGCNQEQFQSFIKEKNYFKFKVQFCHITLIFDKDDFFMNVSLNAVLLIVG